MNRVTCPDCGCPCEDWGTAGYRCPWTTAKHRRTAWAGTILVLSCGKPFERRREMMIQLPQRTAK